MTAVTGSVAVRGGGLRGAAAAEWTKLWSVRSTWWCLLAGAVLMAAAGAQFGIYAADVNTDPAADPADRTGVVGAGVLAAQAVEVGQFAFVALAMLVVTAEYSSGMMRTSLLWTPRRWRLLAARTLVLAGVIFVAGVVAALGAAAAAWPLAGTWARVRPGELAGDVAAVGVYLALVAVITMGVAVALRSAAGTLTLLFSGLTVVPAILRATRVGPLETVSEYLPGTAGAVFMRGLEDPYPPVAGLVILLVWAAVVWAAGLAVLNRRDA
ncbi:ABC transporter permease [Actinomadura craniellae]|uniref:ABC transporter permease n=1 Tax=Actinomadura craniellae TaxID=2231787 RepID=A0A365H4T6_9ACTN|nr:ABC transporter permease [Actinomadura craniellae]RAY14028.1 ABC transporter permease [Actinomadura craniellae]